MSDENDPLFVPANLNADGRVSAPRLPNLEPDQFWFGLRVAGHEAALRDWLGTLNDPESPAYDPVSWAVASAKLEYAKYFERDHPLVEMASAALGLSSEELDDLWLFAAS
jgi:hypothetical protein